MKVRFIKSWLKLRNKLANVFRRKVDVGNTRKSDLENIFGIRFNLGNEPTSLSDHSQAPDSLPHKGDDGQCYTRQCQICTETVFYHFNNSAA